MAPDPARLAFRARSTLAWATLAAVLFLAIGAVILVTNPGDEERGGNTRSIVRGEDYITVIDIFAFPGDRLTGFWSTGFSYGDPDLVQLVAGSDVARILEGQPPEHRYKTFPAWSDDGSGADGVGDVTFVMPRFTCSGPEGGCEEGDLPAFVITRGDDWVGSPATAFVRDDFRHSMPDVVTTVHEAWVRPAIVTLSVMATVALGVALAAGVTWVIAAKRAPAPSPPGPVRLAATEAPLQLVHLSRLYLDSIERSLYVSAGVAVALSTAIQVWGITYVVDGHLEDHFASIDPLSTWIWLLHWWIVPIAVAVAAVFWARHVRELRAEKRRWSGIADRLSTLETQVLG